MLLVAIILMPVIGALALLAIPSEQEENIRRLALVISLIVFLLSLGLIAGFESGKSGWQFETDIPWISQPEIHFHVGIDGISLWLILLTTFLMPVSLLASWNIHERVNAHFA